MNPEDKLNLQKMINANDVDDCTDDIRQKRHSSPIRRDVRRMVEIKRDAENSDAESLDDLLAAECGFLFTNYTDIFNKVRKDEIDLAILYRLLDVLGTIENGEADQHEGSYRVGSLLKELYVDSALRKAKKLDDERGVGSAPARTPKQVSWAQFQAMHLRR